MFKSEEGNTSFLIAGRSERDVKITRCTAKKSLVNNLNFGYEKKVLYAGLYGTRLLIFELFK